jgi:hypothetical protein
MTENLIPEPTMNDTVRELEVFPPTAQEIIEKSQFLSDFVALTYNGQNLIPAQSMDEAVAVLLGTGEIVSMDFFNQGLAPSMGAGLSISNMVALATFCGFDRPKYMDDSLFCTMVRRILGNFVLNRNPVSVNNLHACKSMVALLPEAQFEMYTFTIPSIDLVVEKALRLNVLELFRGKAELYETFRFLLTSKRVKLVLTVEKALMIDVETGETVSEAPDLLTLVTNCHEVKEAVSRVSGDDTAEG